MTIDKERLRALAEAMPAWEWDSNQTPFYNDPDGNSRGGECDGSYVVYGPEVEIDGDSYDGQVLSERCGKNQAEFICEAAPAVLALLAENAALAAENERLRKDAARYCEFFTAGLPITFLGVDYYDKPSLDAAIDAARDAIPALLSENAALAAEVERLRKNAARYEWLRAQFWHKSNLFVVQGDKSNVMLGTRCPSKSSLDDAIDAAMADKGAPT